MPALIDAERRVDTQMAQIANQGSRYADDAGEVALPWIEWLNREFGNANR